MLQRLLAPAALLCAMISPALARADNFTFQAVGGGGGFNGSGTLTTTNNGNGSYSITGLTGTGIISLFPMGGFNGNDNLLFPTSTSLLDTKGFSFVDVMGNTSFNVNLFSNGAGGYSAFFIDSDNNSQTIPITFQTAAVTPEPSSFLLLGTGLLGVFFVVRRKYAQV